ncbi:ParB N-terminal domain-containing protein [Sulfolobus acidocaldarius]|uniref:ParB N-terminal domain-containing protein n=1 Tax=Sulfolobus acidocaldarius TaxID=2285 RepID=UPI0007824EA5|nr:ParB N-terminal domain-containing protein [Sulfolobus acidocaldarius]
MTELTYTEEVVPIEKLREDEEFRSLVPPNNMKEQLISSIAKNGQTLPIDVDSSYIILDGYTRFEIFRELKFKEVKVRKWNFKSPEDRATAYKLIAMLNLQRRHLEKNEVLKLLRELAEKIEKSSKEVQKFSPTGENLEHNNEINTKPDKTEIKSEERQNYGPNGPYFAQNNETNTKPADLELKMKQVKEEIGAKEVTDSDIKKYSIISTIPFLRQLVDDGKIPLRTAYELYTKAKDKLQKIANLPPTERNQLLTTKEGRKIILERDDLLQPILEHKMAVSQAINKIKTEEKLQRSKKKSRTKEEEDEDLDETEDEGEEVETDEGEDSESEEYDLVGEWQRANEEEEKEEEKEKQLTPQFNVNEINNDLESYLKRLVTEGFVELDKTKLYLVTLDGKTYLINARAVNELKSGKGVGKYKKLEEFIQSKGLGFYDPEEGAYSISYQLLA